MPPLALKTLRPTRLNSRRICKTVKSSTGQREHGIHITSYMTLAYGKALKDEVIARIAAKHNATPAQVILAWAMGEGYAVIPSSTKRDKPGQQPVRRWICSLDDEDRQAIAALDCNDRLVSPEGLAPAVGLSFTRYRHAVRPAAREGTTTAPPGAVLRGRSGNQ